MAPPATPVTTPFCPPNRRVQRAAWLCQIFRPRALIRGPVACSEEVAHVIPDSPCFFPCLAVVPLLSPPLRRTLRAALEHLQLAACGSPFDADDATSWRHPCQALTRLPRCALPIVLRHGFAGFERIGPLNYFFMVAADLRSRGETVIERRSPPFDSSAVARPTLPPSSMTPCATGACKVNLIGHSGGIDARALVSQLGYGGGNPDHCRFAAPRHPGGAMPRWA